jgi:transposase-like protein
MTQHIGAAPYQRTEDHKGHRNGYKPRTLKTRVGKLELLVPQDLKRAPSRLSFSLATKETRRRLFWL